MNLNTRRNRKRFDNRYHTLSIIQKMRDGVKSKKIKFRTICLIAVILFSNMFTMTASSAYPDYDVNCDGSCDILDLVLVGNIMGEVGTPGWIREDVIKDGVIDLLDMVNISEHYGENGFSNDDCSRIKKLSFAYGNSMNYQSNREFIANHFDMVVFSRDYLSGANHIKSINQNITILGYYDAILMDDRYPDWSYVDQFENWFIHDIYENRIFPNYYPNARLMNISSGWKNYFAQESKKFLENNSQFDGIFADDVATDLYQDGYTFNVPFSDIPQYVLSNWDQWMLEFMQNAKNNIGEKILMPNAYKHMQYASEATGITFWEGFIHGRSHEYNQNGYGTDGWNYGLVAIDLLHQQAQLGNIIAVNCGCKNANLYPSEAKEWLDFTYACFSFAVEDLNKSYYSWQFFLSDSSNGYHEEMDRILGQPSGEYYHVNDTNLVYAREFTNYHVAANLDLIGTSDVSFSIDGLDYTLSPRTAVFIEK